MSEESAFDACLEATNNIWDDREAYILAVLATLHIDPEIPVRRVRWAMDR